MPPVRWNYKADIVLSEVSGQAVIGSFEFKFPHERDPYVYVYEREADVTFR